MGYPLVTTEQYPIKVDYYYILDFRNLLKPKLLPQFFMSKKRARMCLEAKVPKNELKFYSIRLGGKINSEKLRYRITNSFWRTPKYTKPRGVTLKNHRTKMRRRLRRMGLLTSTPAKVRITDSTRFRYIVNTQEVANSPNTEAQAFQLDRKPGHLYYLILSKKPNRTFFTFDCMRLDVKNQTIKRVKIKGRRTDIITPYILPEIWNLINKKRGYSELIKAFKRAKKEPL